MCEENITPSSLKLGCCLRPSWHQRVPHRLQQGGAVWLLTELSNFSLNIRAWCFRFNKELQHQIHYLEVSGTGEAWSPQSPGHFQRFFFKESQESRSSKSSAPSVYLAQRSIVTLLSFPLLSFILFPPLALEELCVTIEAGRCFQNLERREFRRLD